MAQSYFSLVTKAGKIKLAESAAGGSPVVITHFAVGDGNGAETNPTAASTALVREVWRTAVESVETDPDNPAAVLVTAIIPTNAGGWWMREFGIFANDGTMIAVAKPVSQYKPTALEGQLEDIRYEFQIIIGESANVTLLVDPSLLFATREWVSTRKIPMVQMMRLPWLPVVSMTVTAPPAAPAQGDTYLVPDGATGAWAVNVGKIAEWTGSAWTYVAPPNGHGISLPNGRVFERIGGTYIEKLALDSQSGKWNYASAGGTANALTATFAPAISSYTDGMRLYVKVTADNTSNAVTLNAGAGPVTVTRANGALVVGDMKSGMTAELIYSSGANAFHLVNPAAAKGWRLIGSTMSLANSVQTVVGSWNLAVENRLGSASVVNAGSGNIKIGAGDAGIYVLSCAGAVTSPNCTAELALININGTTYGLDKVQVSSDTDLDRSTTCIVRLNVGDTVQFLYSQTSGGTTTMINWMSTFFSGVWIGA